MSIIAYLFGSWTNKDELISFISCYAWVFSWFVNRYCNYHLCVCVCWSIPFRQLFYSSRCLSPERYTVAKPKCKYALLRAFKTNLKKCYTSLNIIFEVLIFVYFARKYLCFAKRIWNIVDIQTTTTNCARMISEYTSGKVKPFRNVFGWINAYT